MEKVSYLLNGQWVLSKGVPTKPGSYDGGRGYSLDLTDESGMYTGKDLDKLVDTGIKNIKDHNGARVKRLVNEDTGSEEDHVLMHFGRTQEGTPGELNHVDLDKSGYVGILGKQGAVVSGDPNFSHSFTGNGTGSLYSFWVPKSKIAHMASHPFGNVSGYHNMDREQRKKFIRDSLDQYSGDEYDSEAEGKQYTRALFHNKMTGQEQHGDGQALWHSFARVHPGRYRPATLDEVKSSFLELANHGAVSHGDLDQILSTHTKTHAPR